MTSAKPNAPVPASSAGPRFLFFSNELVGLGHLRRQLALSGRLAGTVAGATSLIVTGTPCEPFFTLPDGVDAITLPKRIRDDTGRQAGKLRIELAELHDIRSRIALAAATSFRPAVVVVDKLPLGPAGELIPTLEALRSASNSKVVLGLRDIDDSPERVRSAWEGLRESVERYFDAIVVYGPPGSPHAVHCLDWPDLQIPVRHVGYVTATMPASGGGPLPSGYVLATAGSGRSGFGLLSTFLEAVALDPLPHHAVVLTGPFMDAGEKSRLRELARGLDVEVWEFRSDIGRLIAHAVGIVGMAGYNTVAESLRSGKPALLVPRVMPSEEQLVRARFLVAEGLADMIHPGELTPARMREGLERLVTRDSPAPAPGLFQGTERAAALLSSLAGEGRGDSVWVTAPTPVEESGTGGSADPSESGGAVWAYGSAGLGAGAAASH